MDLTPYMDQYPELKADNFFEGSIETTKFDNKIVGVPWYIDTRVLYYRTDLLASIGYEEAPNTWEELSDAAEKLAQRGDPYRRSSMADRSYNGQDIVNHPSTLAGNWSEHDHFYRGYTRHSENLL